MQPTKICSAAKSIMIAEKAREYAQKRGVPVKAALASIGLTSREGECGVSTDLPEWIERTTNKVNFRQTDRVSRIAESLEKEIDQALRERSLQKGRSYGLAEALTGMIMLKLGPHIGISMEYIQKELVGSDKRPRLLGIQMGLTEEKLELLSHRSPFVPEVEGRVRLREGEEAVIGGQLKGAEWFDRRDIPAILDVFQNGGQVLSGEKVQEAGDRRFKYRIRPNIGSPSGAEITLTKFYTPGAPRQNPYLRQLFYNGQVIFENEKPENRGL